MFLLFDIDVVQVKNEERHTGGGGSWSGGLHERNLLGHWAVDLVAEGHFTRTTLKLATC